MLNIATVRDWAERLDAGVERAASVAIPVIDDAAQAGELIDPAHAPLYVLVAQIGAELNAELAKLEEGQETASQALLDLLPDALAAWRSSLPTKTTA